MNELAPSNLIKSLPFSVTMDTLQAYTVQQQQNSEDNSL